MSGEADSIYDVVGIGFGPSNLSLAIALDEARQNGCCEPLAVAFFERQKSFGWHRNMLLPSAKMQVSFLKDLATFRNPVSPFSFVSYLHSVGRLARFVNNKDFFPSRQEFHDYLTWAEAQVSDRVTYQTEVVAIDRASDPLERACYALTLRHAHGRDRTVYARNVVISTGLVPRMPEGIRQGERVWHSSEFLGRFNGTDQPSLRRVAVAGAGQSAAEVARFLHGELPKAEIYAIIPSYGYSIADDTPFANEVFDPSAVDEYHSGSGGARDAFWQYHRNTNYSVVSHDVITDIYRQMYEEEIQGRSRLTILKLSRVGHVKTIGRRLCLNIETHTSSLGDELDVDLLVCATGYEPMQIDPLLGRLGEFCLRDATDRYLVERDYQIATTSELPGGIYLQGGTEHTHGLASSLLSNIAVRSGEIVNSIQLRLDRLNSESADQVPASQAAGAHPRLRKENQ